MYILFQMQLHNFILLLTYMDLHSVADGMNLLFSQCFNLFLSSCEFSPFILIIIMEFLYTDNHLDQLGYFIVSKKQQTNQPGHGLTHPHHIITIIIATVRYGIHPATRLGALGGRWQHQHGTGSSLSFNLPMGLYNS